MCTEELARLKKSWIWAVLSGTETIGHFLLDFLVIHKVKWIKRVLIWWKLKDNYFSHQNGIKWPLMDKRKLKIYFQTKLIFGRFSTKWITVRGWGVSGQFWPGHHCWAIRFVCYLIKGILYPKSEIENWNITKTSLKYQSLK